MHLDCLLHRCVMASITLPAYLELVLDYAVHIVNTIKSNTLDTQLSS